MYFYLLMNKDFIIIITLLIIFPGYVMNQFNDQLASLKTG